MVHGRILFVAALAAAATGLLPQAPASHGGSVVPCGDPRGCPDMATDPYAMNPYRQVMNFPATHCAVQEGMVKAGTRTLIRFTFSSPNIGAGDLFLGDPDDHPEWFVGSTCHGHLHMREYADYRLWTRDGFFRWDMFREEQPDRLPEEILDQYPYLRDELLVSSKQGFCVIDIQQYRSLPGRYFSCGYQGISPGWADVYGSGLDGQWVDVTEVEPGDYVLEAEVNAERFYDESDYANNRAWRTVLV